MLQAALDGGHAVAGGEAVVDALVVAVAQVQDLAHHHLAVLHHGPVLDLAHHQEQRAVAELVEVVVAGPHVEAAQVGDEHAGGEAVVTDKEGRQDVVVVGPLDEPHAKAHQRPRHAEEEVELLVHAGHLVGALDADLVVHPPADLLEALLVLDPQLDRGDLGLLVLLLALHGEGHGHMVARVEALAGDEGVHLRVLPQSPHGGVDQAVGDVDVERLAGALDVLQQGLGPDVVVEVDHRLVAFWHDVREHPAVGVELGHQGPVRSRDLHVE